MGIVRFTTRESMSGFCDACSIGCLDLEPVLSVDKMHIVGRPRMAGCRPIRPTRMKKNRHLPEFTHCSWKCIINLAALVSAVHLPGCSASAPTSPTSASSGGGYSDDTSGGAGGASGGNALNGGSTSVGGVSGGGSSAGRSKYELCAELYVTMCQRRYVDCQKKDIYNDYCPGEAFRCPDALFNENSGTTEAAVARCIDLWRGASCSDLNNSRWPDCALGAGLLALGEPCKFKSECASGACVGPAPNGVPTDCGQCATVLSSGAACSGAVPAACPTNTICTGQCTVIPPVGLAAGSSCSSGIVQQCQGTLSCIAESGAGACQERKVDGSGCSTSEQCLIGSHCSASSFSCVKSPANGSACASSVEVAGQVCANGTCDASAVPSVCKAFDPAGTPCTIVATDWIRAGNCERTLRCLCKDATCSTRVCANQRLAGQSCAEANSACIDGTICTNGFCVPVESQALIAHCTG